MQECLLCKTIYILHEIITDRYDPFKCIAPPLFPAAWSLSDSVQTRRLREKCICVQKRAFRQIRGCFMSASVSEGLPSARRSISFRLALQSPEPPPHLWSHDMLELCSFSSGCCASPDPSLCRCERSGQELADAAACGFSQQRPALRRGHHPHADQR